MKRKETEDIVGELISAMNLNISVSQIIDNGDNNYTIKTCNTLLLQVGYSITINAVVRKITAVVNNVSFDVQGGPLPTDLIIPTYLPFYKYGTIISTNAEINKNNDALDITPLVYLRTEFSETFFNRDEAMDRESDLEIYFLTQNSFGQTEDDIRKAGVLPMRNLAYLFIESLNKNRMIGNIDTYVLKNWLRFGFETANGEVKKIFNYCDLSGCQLNITLPIGKDLACCN